MKQKFDFKQSSFRDDKSNRNPSKPLIVKNCVTTLFTVWESLSYAFRMDVGIAFAIATTI